VLTTILLCTFVYFVVGYGGYIYGDRWTCGNILLNYNPKSTLFAVVRVFMAGTLMCSYPLLILPCRNSLNRLLFLCSATDVEEQVDAEQRLHESSIDPSNISFVGEKASLSRSMCQSFAHQTKKISGSQKTAWDFLDEERRSLGLGSSLPRSMASSLPRSMASSLPRSSCSDKDMVQGLLPNDIDSEIQTGHNFEVSEEDLDIHVNSDVKQPQPTEPGMSGAVSYAQLGDAISSPNKQTVYVYAARESTDGKELHRVDFYERDEEGGLAKELSSQRLIVLTVGIVGSTITVAVFLDAVMIIWTVMGATVAFTIAFILPTLFFRKLMFQATSTSEMGQWSVGKIRRQAAGLILVVAIMMSIVCTAVTGVQVVQGLPSCPT